MIRRMLILFALTAALLIPTGMNAASPPILQPGLWEITIKTELSETVTPTTVTQVCISKDKADHPEPRKSKPKDDCQVTGGLTGSLSKYSVKCGRARTAYDAEFTYNGDHFEGTVTYKGDITVRQVYTARRLGECTSTEE